MATVNAGIVIRRYPWVVSIGFANTNGAGLLATPVKAGGIGGTSTPGQPQQYAHGISNMSFDLDLFEPSTFSFHLPWMIPNPKHDDDPTQAPLIENPAFKYIRKGFTDVWAYRDGFGIFRGRLMDIDESFGENGGLSLKFIDYRGLLDAVSGVDPAFTYTNLEQTDLIWKVLQNSETNSPLGLSKGTWAATTVLLDGSVDLDVSAWDVIHQITTSDLGPDLSIDMDNKVNLYWPGRGTDRGVVLDIGGLINGGSISSSMSGYSNVVRQYAGSKLVDKKAVQIPPFLYTNDASIEQNGRWFTAVKNPTPSLTTEAMRDAYGRAIVRKVSNLEPQFTLPFAMGGWRGPQMMFLGDPVGVHVPYGLHRGDYKSRVIGLKINVDSNLNETVTTDVGDRKKDVTKELKAFAKKYKGDALQNAQQLFIANGGLV